MDAGAPPWCMMGLMPRDPRITAFLRQAERTLNQAPVLVSLDAREARADRADRSPAGLCADLARGVESGDFSVALLAGDDLRESYDLRREPSAEDATAVPCDPERLRALAAPFPGLGDFLAKLLAGRDPFAEGRPHPWLPRYDSVYDQHVSQYVARDLSRGLLDALGTPFEGDFCLLPHRAFERDILAPSLRKVVAPDDFYFWNLGNDSVILFGGPGKLFVLLTSGTD